jgi:hypothetical protein
MLAFQYDNDRRQSTKIPKNDKFPSINGIGGNERTDNQFVIGAWILGEPETNQKRRRAYSSFRDFHLGAQLTNDTPSLRTWLNSRKAIQLLAISAGPAPAETEFSVDELPLAALEEAMVFFCPSHSGGTSADRFQRRS